MKKALPIVTSALFALSAAALYSADGQRYRINAQGSTDSRVDFWESSSWNQYDNGGWTSPTDVPDGQTPWEAYNNVDLKMDNSHAYLDQSATVYQLRGLYLSSLLVTGIGTELTITNNSLHSDGNHTTKSKVTFEEGTVLNVLNGGIEMWQMDVNGTASNKVTLNTKGFSMREYGTYNITHAVWNNTDSGWSVARGATVMFDNVVRNNLTTSMGDFSVTNFVAGEANDVRVTIKDNSSFEFNNGGWNSARNEGQTYTFEMIGENSHWNYAGSLQFQDNAYAYTGGESLLHVGGKNNIFEVHGDFNVMGYSNHGGDNTGGKFGIVIDGEGNSFYSQKRLHLGKNDGNAKFIGGEYYFHATSENDANKADIRVSSINLGIGNSTDSVTSTLTNELVIGDNVNFSGYYADGDARTAARLSIGTNSSTYDGTKMNGGTVSMLITGSNNDLYLENVNVLNGNNITTGASAVLNWAGSNNKVELTGELNLASNDGQTGGHVDFSAAGTNNSYKFGSVRVISRNQTNTTADLVFGGTGNTFATTGDFRLASDNNLSGSTATALLKAGNTFTVGGQLLIGNSDNNAAAHEMVYGRFTMETGARMTVGSLRIGAGSTTQARNTSGRMTVKGNAYVTVNGDLNLHSSSEAVYGTNDLGGYLVFEADADANLGTVDVYGSFNKNNGFIVVDFSKIVGVVDDGLGGEKYWTIIYFTRGTLTRDDIKFVLRDGDEEDAAYARVMGDELRVYYHSTVPEPSTYAAILGALALGFAAYRRRKA